MKQLITLLVLLGTFYSVTAQTSNTYDSLAEGKITVYKDSRLDLLAKKEQAINDLLNSGLRSTKGYRLMLLSTNDRPAAMKLRGQLLQTYPDQKVYMTFQPPYIKVKFGNFLEKEEAEKIRKEIIKNKLVATNIYLVPETIEVKAELLKEKESQTP